MTERLKGAKLKKALQKIRSKAFLHQYMTEDIKRHKDREPTVYTKLKTGVPKGEQFKKR